MWIYNYLKKFNQKITVYIQLKLIQSFNTMMTILKMKIHQEEASQPQ